MPFTAHTLAQTLRLVADETATLRTFIDDLDGWDGKDLDTGTNAFRTFSAIAHSLEDSSADLSFATGLDIAVDAGITHGAGHCGQLITLVLQSWNESLQTAEHLTPVTMRRMLAATGTTASSRMTLSAAVSEVLAECQNELAELGDTLPEVDDLINMYAAHSQFALVEATNHTTGRIDPGAAVLTVFFTCFDAVVRQDTSLLSSLAHMLADLASSPQTKGPRPHAPEANRAFTVDMVVSASQHEVDELCDRFTLLGANFSCVGREDIFGLGEWRIHADTSAPLSVLPRHLPVHAFTVADARPHEMLGVDTLTDGVTHRGVRILERRPAQRVERAHVLVLTHAPGMLEYFAQAGTTAVLNPTDEDLPLLMSLAGASSTGVTLVIPTSADTRALADAMGARSLPGDRLCVAHCEDDLSALVLAQATGTIFVPQPGGYQVGNAVEELIEQASKHAGSTFACARITSLEARDVVDAVETLKDARPVAWRLLVSDHDPMGISAIAQQLIATVPPYTASLEVIDAGYSGPAILQGLQ